MGFQSNPRDLAPLLPDQGWIPMFFIGRPRWFSTGFYPCLSVFICGYTLFFSATFAVSALKNLCSCFSCNFVAKNSYSQFPSECRELNQAVPHISGGGSNSRHRFLSAGVRPSQYS